MKKAIVILGLLALTNCAYKPKINPEASRDPFFCYIKVNTTYL